MLLENELDKCTNSIKQKYFTLIEKNCKPNDKICKLNQRRDDFFNDMSDCLK